MKEIKPILKGTKIFFVGSANYLKYSADKNYYKIEYPKSTIAEFIPKEQITNTQTLHKIRRDHK